MNARIHIAAVVVTMLMCQQVHAQTEEEPEQTEATELEGSWRAVSFLSAGRPRNPACVLPLWRFEGNRCFKRRSNEAWRERYTVSLDSSVMPAEMDRDTGWLGIYMIENDSLTICVGGPPGFEPGIRPDRFESTEDYRTQLMVLRRVTEEDDE